MPLKTDASRRSSVVSLADALPGIWSAREKGVLVPFVGAGISRNYCRGWADFARELAKQTNTAAAIPQDPSPDDLYRIADRAAAALRRCPVEERIRKIKTALRTQQSDLPKQAVALSEHNWPLIVTTNYDDILLSIKRSEKLPPTPLGRSQDDCARVVRSLSAEDQPLLWYVQGFVPVTTDSFFYKDIDRLVSEVVLGHQNYQSAINSAHAFRRAFSELFRRRSIIFIGSGLSESYFVNLIAESLHALGPGPFAHYALFSRKELYRVDAEFLAVRLGVTPICYGDDFDSLEQAIQRMVRGPAGQSGGVTAPARSPMVSGLCFAIPCQMGSGSASQVVNVALKYGCLPIPFASSSNERPAAVILSGGREKDVKGWYPYLGGPMASSFLKSYRECISLASTWHDIGGQNDGRVFRLGTELNSPIFVATSSKDHSSDSRDSSTIVEATRRSLTAVDEENFTSATMGVLSAGKRAPGTPLQCLIAQLVGINVFLQSGPTNLKNIEIWTPDEAIWRFISSDRISVLELLTSRLARVLVRIESATGDWEEFALSVPHGETVLGVVQRYDLQVAADQISVRPLIDLQDENLLNWSVFPGMTVEVHYDNKSASIKASNFA